MTTQLAIPDNPSSRDAQKLRKSIRAYGALEVDPENPIEGWTWYRKDLTPPQIRTKLNGIVYGLDLLVAPP